MGTGELLGKPNKLRGVTCGGLASRPGGVEILLAASCYGNRDKLRPDEPLWLQGFTFFLWYMLLLSFDNQEVNNFKTLFKLKGVCILDCFVIKGQTGLSRYLKLEPFHSKYLLSLLKRQICQIRQPHHPSKPKPCHNL